MYDTKYIYGVYIYRQYGICAFDEDLRGSNKSFPREFNASADSRTRKEQDRLYFSRLRSIAEMHGVEYVKRVT